MKAILAMAALLVGSAIAGWLWRFITDTEMAADDDNYAPFDDDNHHDHRP
jgi:hypothetical protein